MENLGNNETKKIDTSFYVGLFGVIAIAVVIWLTASHSVGNSDFKSGMWNPERAVADFGKMVGAWSTSWMEPGVVQKTIAYFIYEMVKLPIILGATTYILSVIRLSIPRTWLERSISRDDMVGQSKGILLGMLTPVCSCVVSPIYAGLVVGGGSTKATAAFLFAAPSMNVFAMAVMAYIGGFSLLGIYLAIGFLGAFLTARLANKIGIARELLNKEIMNDVFCVKSRNVFAQAGHETWKLMKKLFVALTVTGAAAALLFHFNAVPVELLKTVAYSWYAPLVALIGIPLDVNAASSLPLIAGVFSSIGKGTLVAFMLAMTVTSIPQIFVLAKMYNYATTARLIAWYAFYAASAGLAINMFLV